MNGLIEWKGVCVCVHTILNAFVEKKKNFCAFYSYIFSQWNLFLIVCCTKVMKFQVCFWVVLNWIAVLHFKSFALNFHMRCGAVDVDWKIVKRPFAHANIHTRAHIPLGNSIRVHIINGVRMHVLGCICEWKFFKWIYACFLSLSHSWLFVSFSFFVRCFRFFFNRISISIHSVCGVLTGFYLWTVVGGVFVTCIRRKFILWRRRVYFTLLLELCFFCCCCLRQSEVIFTSFIFQLPRATILRYSHYVVWHCIKNYICKMHIYIFTMSSQF